MFDKAYNQVKQLVEDFKASESHFLSATYSEAEVRKDFIDKFFTILGWDVDHHFQKNPFQQEVKVEKAQRQEGHQSQKRADYAFSLAPDFKRTLFFVEAKKPSRLLRQNKDDYFQTAKYGWNSQTGISILTDFQELVIIDCRFKPDFDTILKDEIKYYRYEDYANEDVFSEIYWLFSREAVVAGNLTTFIESLQKPKAKEKQLKLSGGKYQSIDESFLNYIDDIRLQMAQAFHANNPTLDYYDLTEATQRTIDRLVFIRFLEDKQIEPEDLMHSISTANYPWQKFIEISKRLDAKYNGVVFKEHFIDKKAFLGADEELFRSIAADLDHTNTPYDFNYIPIHILGNIYERFLGKIIVIENGKASIELKPEVRKAGGVFYTPKYIVDYIVENTVGKLIADKKPKEIAKLTFADIACGSGSFLIGVFDYLLDYHKNYYNEYTDEAEKEGCKFDAEKGVWTMSINQKKQILINNVYGVDIDLQATEVTQVSLFLKLLEDETMGTVAELNQLFVADKILPDLSNNIKCGNSLIGTEIMFDVLDFGKEEIRKLNPFDFETAFPNVFRKGGFDAIVGNPPYVKEYTNREIFEHVKKGKLKKYYQGKMDFWYFFTCYGVDMLKEHGLLGYIIPNNWVSNAGASILRNKVIKNSKIYELIDFNGFMVFDDASIQTMIMLIEKNSKTDNYEFLYKRFSKDKLKHIEVEKELIENTSYYSKTIYPKIKRKDLENKFLKFSESKLDSLLEKVLSSKNFEFNSKEITNGIHPHHGHLNKKMVEILNNEYKIGTGVFALNESELEKLNLNINENSIIKPYYFNSNELGRYFINNNKDWIIYTDSSFKNLDKINNYPNIKNHLDKFRAIITSDNKPYGLHRARNENFFLGEKIVSLRMCNNPTFIYDNKISYFSAAFNILKTERINLKYLIGILNSSLIKIWLQNKGKKQGNIFQIDKEPLMQIPIHKTTNQQLHDDLVKLVEQMLKAKKEEQSAQSDHEKNLYKNLTDSLDYKINNLVYKLYNLTPEEIDLVENS